MLNIFNYLAIFVSLVIIVVSLITSDWLWVIIFLLIAVMNYLAIRYSDKTTKEHYFANGWVAYIMLHKLTRPMLGFTIGFDRVDVDLIYVSLGFWR